MTPIARARLQGALLDRIRASVPGGRPSASEIANVIGCDRSEVSRFASGERRMDLDELVAAADEYGVDAVFGPVAEHYGRTLTASEVPATVRELPHAAGRLTVLAAQFSAALGDALADGAVDEDEAAGLQALIDQLGAASHRVTARRVVAVRAVR